MTNIQIPVSIVKDACERKIAAIEKRKSEMIAANKQPRRFWQSPPYHEMAIAFYGGRSIGVCESMIRLCRTATSLGYPTINVSRDDLDRFQGDLQWPDGTKIGSD